MPSLQIPKSGLPLTSPDADFVPADILGVTLSDDVIEDMIKSVRDGKSIQLSLGTSPKFSFGPHTHYLSPSLDPFEFDFYRTILPPKTSTQPNQPNMPAYFLGQRCSTSFQVSKSKKSLDEAKETSQSHEQKMHDDMISANRKADQEASSIAMSGADAALTALKNSLASESARKKNNTTVHIKDASSLPPAIQQKASSKSKHTSRILGHSKNASLASVINRSAPNSPALSGVGSPALIPTSVPESQRLAEKAKAIRKPIVHILALGPSTEDTLFKYKDPETARPEYKLAIEKVADLIDGRWKLTPKSFKELDVFKFKPYTDDERQVAIANAVKAYDKLRLNSSEPEWQRLLPFGERGTGKCLSKLQAKIATGALHPPKISLHQAEDSGRDTPKENERAEGGETMVRSSSQGTVPKTKKVGESDAQAKRLLAKPSKKPVAKSRPDKKISSKESSRIKSAQFVNDSDEDMDPVVDEPNSASKTVVRERKHEESKGNKKHSVQEEKAEEENIKPKAATERARNIKRAGVVTDSDDDDYLSSSKTTASSDATKAKKSAVARSSGIRQETLLSDSDEDDEKSLMSKAAAKNWDKANSTLKRPRNEYEDKFDQNAKKPKQSLPRKTSPLAFSPTQKGTDTSDSSLTSLDTPRKRSVDVSPDTAPEPKRHQKSSSISTTSSDGSSLMTPLRRQIVLQKARDFKQIYVTYKELYHSISGGVARDSETVQELLGLHQKLSMMKREICKEAQA